MASADDWRQGAPPKDTRPIQIVFPTIKVSQRVHNMINGLELAIGGASTCPMEEMDIAYAGVNVARESLYRYLEILERRAKIERTYIKRF